MTDYHIARQIEVNNAKYLNVQKNQEFLNTVGFFESDWTMWEKLHEVVRYNTYLNFKIKVELTLSFY